MPGSTGEFSNLNFTHDCAAKAVPRAPALHCGRPRPPAANTCPGLEPPDAYDRAREEGKVVTVPFAGMAGFTSRARQLDPEEHRCPNGGPGAKEMAATSR
jgi:hypothetical protein